MSTTIGARTHLGWLAAVLACALPAAAPAGCGGAQRTGSGMPEEEEEEEVGGGVGGDGEGGFVSPEKYDEIDSVFKMKRPSIIRCYNDAVQDETIDPKTAGRVSIGLTISGSGKPSRVRITESTLRPKASVVEGCIVDTVTSWTFPAPGTAIEYSYGYDFEPW